MKATRTGATREIEGAMTAPRLCRTSSEIRMDHAYAEYRLLDSFIDNFLDGRSEKKISRNEKSDGEKSGSEHFSSEKSSSDSSIDRSAIEESSAIEARSDDTTSSTSDSSADNDSVSATVRDPGGTTALGEPVRSDDGSAGIEPVRAPKSKRRQKAKLAGVILSFPVRAAACALHLPFIALEQIGTSVGRAIRKDKSASAARWPRDTTLAPIVYKKYGRCMILHGQSDDAQHAVSRQIRVTRRNRKVREEDITGFDKSPTFKVLGLDGRLDIMAHGDAETVDEFDPAELADWLAVKKLKRVGVLNVDSCHAGAKTFLEELRNEMHHRGIQFGWIAGSRESTGDLRVVSKLGKKRYSWATYPYFWKRTSGLTNKPASLNRKILKGNVDVNFRGTLFNDKKPFFQVASSYSPFR